MRKNLVKIIIFVFGLFTLTCVFAQPKTNFGQKGTISIGVNNKTIFSIHVSMAHDLNYKNTKAELNILGNTVYPFTDSNSIAKIKTTATGDYDVHFLLQLGNGVKTPLNTTLVMMSSTAKLNISPMMVTAYGEKYLVESYSPFKITIDSANEGATHL